MSTEFQLEQKRVDDVMETITEEIGKLENETSRRKDEVIHIRKHFWDEVKVSTDSFDDYLETIIGLRQEAQALSVSQSSHRHASKRLITLRKMQEIPYFGRIDFIEDGIMESEQIYIGISALMDQSGEDFLIYDWRAPISSVYYDYQPGRAKYTTPGGEIEGNLEKKWQYLIRNGELESMFDTSLTIGDEILQKVLGKATADNYMHNIVATIQQEQNRIIRHDSGRLLIVHGAAGSGKTSAALQRIAYLLYKYRDNLDADQIILFSPNSMFKSYVSNVLPELGEESMQQVTFQEYLDHRLSKAFQVENPYEQLEYVMTEKDSPGYNARLSGIKFKASLRFYDTIQSYIESLGSRGMTFKDISFRGETILTAKQISERFYHHETDLRLSNRLEKLKEWLIKELKSIQKTEIDKPWVQEEMELLSNEEYNEARAFLAKKKGFEREDVADYEVDPRALARLLVQKKMKPLRQRIRGYQFISFKDLYQQIFAEPAQVGQWLVGEPPEEWAAICEGTIGAFTEDKLWYEDATPFLLLKELILGFQINSSIKHIVVDEAQDYSPFQFEFMKRLFPAARMTVLGDFNQAIFAHASEAVNFDVLEGLYGPEKTEIINITRSYRSTKPIIEFTRRLVPNGDQIIPFERDGEEPVMTEVADYESLHAGISGRVKELKAKGYHSIAIICQSAAESRRAFEALFSGIENLKLVKMNSMEYEQGVVVVPSYLSKGIEFDAVIIYNGSEEVYGDESLRRLFYTACTRAMHYLEICSVGAGCGDRFLDPSVR
ncbi:UvrD-helicase domain-containing protein [Sutcliffiella horikoshii]|uniref:RNA polymerase recycling motor HelD n=1 Tax=Sutcliffiella horikoshii TaxID=79883 RepID=UPI00203C3AE8|nr:RNA polymerase recycling motor HelD [Sutcliffiella horikoshii]MCM3618357.1 UvrD-helicase domain-containing protein [Sutcliffiella horikoshii]